MARNLASSLPGTRTRTSRAKRWLGAFFLLVATGSIGVADAAGFLGGPSTRFWPAAAPVAYDARGRTTGAILFSGDMGLQFGTSRKIAARLAASGVPVLGFSSSTKFSTHKTRAEVDQIVADAIRSGLAQTGGEDLVVIGQSFGADMLRVGLVDLPAELRAHIAAIVLVVPGEDAYFRADPLGFAYRGEPDEGPASAAALDWAPLICVRGARETDSLCPRLTSANVRAITLPGGHFLNNDVDRLVTTLLDELASVVPGFTTGVAAGS